MREEIITNSSRCNAYDPACIKQRFLVPYATHAVATTKARIILKRIKIEAEIGIIENMLYHLRKAQLPVPYF